MWICYLYIFVYYFACLSSHLFEEKSPFLTPYLITSFGFFSIREGFLDLAFLGGGMPCIWKISFLIWNPIHALKKLQVYTLHTFCNLVWISWHFHRNYKHTLYIQPNFFICIPQAVHAFMNLRMLTCFKATVFLVSAFLSMFPQNSNGDHWEGDNVCLLRTRQYVPGIYSKSDMYIYVLLTGWSHATCHLCARTTKIHWCIGSTISNSYASCVWWRWLCAHLLPLALAFGPSSMSLMRPGLWATPWRFSWDLISPSGLKFSSNYPCKLLCVVQMMKSKWAKILPFSILDV